MKLVAWDTSSKTAALVTLEWEKGEQPKLVSEWTLNVDTTHSERLLWSVDELLRASHWTIDDIDVFGVGVGPGSFTGLRIGVTTARTLAQTLQKPLVAVSSLAALIRPAASWFSQTKDKVTLIGTTDAAKGELFSIYGSPKSMLDCVVTASGDQPGLWKRGVEENVLAPEVLIKNIRTKIGTDGKWLAVGEGRARYLDVWKKLPASCELDAPPFANVGVQGRFLGQLAWEAYQAGISRAPLKVFPNYGRAADAEIKLKAGLLKPGPTRLGPTRGN